MLLSLRNPLRYRRNPVFACARKCNKHRTHIALWGRNLTTQLLDNRHSFKPVDYTGAIYTARRPASAEYACYSAVSGHVPILQKESWAEGTEPRRKDIESETLKASREWGGDIPAQVIVGSGKHRKIWMPKKPSGAGTYFTELSAIIPHWLYREAVEVPRCGYSELYVAGVVSKRLRSDCLLWRNTWRPLRFNHYSCDISSYDYATFGR